MFMYLILGLRGQRSVIICPIEILDEKPIGGPVILLVFDHLLRFCMHEMICFFLEKDFHCQNYSTHHSLLYYNS